MNDYYVRTTQALWPTMLQLGVLLGVIELHYSEFDEEGSPAGEPTVIATEGGAWDYIGEILVDEVPVADAEGSPYLHGNLRTPINLRERAEAMATENPALAEAMGSLGQFFLLDENGSARLPRNPHRVWA